MTSARCSSSALQQQAVDFPLVFRILIAILLLCMTIESAAAITVRERQMYPRLHKSEVGGAISAIYSNRVKEHLERLEQKFAPLLLRKTTSGSSDSALRDLKMLMVHAVLQHDIKTYYCNALDAEWSHEPILRDRAHSVCTRTTDEHQSLCAVFRNRLPALRNMMRSFAALYRDERLHVEEKDIAFWKQILSCGNESEELPPPGDLRYISDLLTQFATAQLAGNIALDPRRNQEFAEYRDVAMGKYRYTLIKECALAPKYDRGILRTMECRAAGLRKG